MFPVRIEMLTLLFDVRFSISLYSGVPLFVSSFVVFPSTKDVVAIRATVTLSWCSNEHGTTGTF